ncbi:MAG: hypothetical protein QXS02_05135 [Candidatus Thermoplasmatota archaeon]
MNKVGKMLSVFMCILILVAAIPLSLAQDPKEVIQQLSPKKRTFVSGFILLPPHPAIGGAYMYFFAVSMRAGQVGGDYHIYRLQPVFVRADYDFHGIAIPGFIIGWFDGPLGLAG